METALTCEIKSELLKFYRYERDMYAVQECYNMDVLVCDRHMKNFYEFEIKVSLSDMKAELKKQKHMYPRTSYFYMVVPPSLASHACEICSQLNEKYGVMVYDSGFHTVKRASKLGVPMPGIERMLLNKLTSDYVKWYAKLQLYEQDRFKRVQVENPHAQVLYRNLMRRYPMDVVLQFEYIENPPQIRYASHKVILGKKCKAGHIAMDYTRDWVEQVMGEIDIWIKSEQRKDTVFKT